jgi:hypothetical protein
MRGNTIGESSEQIVMTTQDKASIPFWEQKRLSEMSHDEWESLCDGCARCCLNKLEDEDDGRIYYTRAACSLLDIPSCRCTDYENRKTVMPACLKLSVEDAHYFDWLPETCAYRLLAEGETLPQWHPLITGTAESVIDAGISVRDFAISETEVEDITEEVISLTHDGTHS